MASISTISLPHGTIPTQMFGNVNLQNAMMYVNENFAAVKEGVNDAVTAANEAIEAKADSDHDHDDTYAALEHSHAQSDITGLQSALDGKAELNHEHSQYLTSLPAHYHATSDVQGLDERLQAKAESVHSHAISDVEGLASELGLRASTAYVDQQVNGVGSSIKTIADQEVESYAADKDDVDDTPKDVEIAPSGETEAQKKARIGTSTAYARKDHQHVFETESSDLTKLKHDGNGTSGAASFGSEDKVPRIDHSHPLNFPTNKPVSSMAQDGMGEGGTAMFGSTNYYADLGHSHPLNVTTTGAPSDCVKSTETATNGTSENYARQDHVHKIPALVATDISYGTSTAGAKLDNHESRIEALEDAPTPTAPVTSVNNQVGKVTLYADDVGALDSDDIGVSVQSYSAPLTTLAGNLNSDGTIPSANVLDGNCRSGGDCFAYFTSSKNLAHLGVTGITVSKANAMAETFTFSAGSPKTAVLNYKAVGETSAPTTQKVVGFAANAENASLVDAATFATYDADNPPTNPSIVSMDADGVLSDEVEIPTTASTSDRVLMVAKNGTTLSFADTSAMGTATDNRSVSSHDSEAQTLGFTDWSLSSANGNGVKIRLYALVDSSQSGEHKFFPIDIEVSSKGIVTSITKPTGNLGVWIGA